MRRLALATVLCWLALTAPAYAAGINVFVGSPTIPSLSNPATANLFVVPSGGQSPCTRATIPVLFSSALASAKCSNTQAAWNAALGGDTVEIQGGSYTGLDVTSSGSVSTRSPAVTMRMASGATATVTGESVWSGVNGLVMDGTTGANGRGFDGRYGVNISGNGSPRTSNVTIKGYKIHDTQATSGATGAAIWMTNCTNIVFQHVDLVNIWGGDGIQMSSYSFDLAGGCDGATFDDVDMSGFACSGTNGDHQDFMQMLSGQNTVVKNSTWIGLHCFLVSGDPSGAQGWFISGGFGAGANHTLENSVIADVQDTAGSFPVAVYKSSGIVMRNNTIVGTIKTETSPDPPSNVTFVNNIANSSCSGSIDTLFSLKGTGSYGNNVLANTCGHATDQVTPSFNAMFVNAAALDFRLTSGSFAIGKANSATATASDYEGGVRDGAPDAGYDEYGAP